MGVSNAIPLCSIGQNPEWLGGNRHVAPSVCGIPSASCQGCGQHWAQSSPGCRTPEPCARGPFKQQSPEPELFSPSGLCAQCWCCSSPVAEVGPGSVGAVRANPTRQGGHSSCQGLRVPVGWCLALSCPTPGLCWRLWDCQLMALLSVLRLSNVLQLFAPGWGREFMALL